MLTNSVSKSFQRKNKLKTKSRLNSQRLRFQNQQKRPQLNKLLNLKKPLLTTLCSDSAQDVLTEDKDGITVSVETFVVIN